MVRWKSLRFEIEQFSQNIQPNMLEMLEISYIIALGIAVFKKVAYSNI